MLVCHVQLRRVYSPDTQSAEGQIHFAQCNFARQLRCGFRHAGRVPGNHAVFSQNRKSTQVVVMGGLEYQPRRLEKGE